MRAVRTRRIHLAAQLGQEHLALVKVDLLHLPILELARVAHREGLAVGRHGAECDGSGECAMGPRRYANDGIGWCAGESESGG